MSTARRVPIPFPLPEDLTGSKIGRFLIRSRLGSGGMGEVYYADDTQLQRPVALKRVARELGRDPAARQRILREARRASVLASEHIAAIHDVVEEDGELFLVMEYVDGTTLRDSIHLPVSVPKFFQIATQCAEGLTVAHQHGIVHCDIKPENIMLTPEGGVKILDFGLAKHAPGSHESTTTESSVGLAGTPAYIAPEVLMECFPDARSDVFSLGVVLYEMLTGRNPFQRGGLVASSDCTLHEEPTAIHVLNSGVPPVLEAVVMKAMAKAPDQRHANAGELLEELREAQTGKSAKTASSEPRPRRWRTRLVALIAVGLLIACSIGLYLQTRPHPLAERSWVLVSDFQTSGEDAIPEEGVREGLTIALQQSRYVNIYPRARVYEVLRRMKRDGAQRIDEALGREICQRENLPVLLAGSVENVGGVFQISVRALDPVHGNVLFAERQRFARHDQFFDKVDSLAKQIRRDLGESLAGIESASRPLAKVTTSSLEALQLYSQAEDAKDQGKDERVEGLLRSALQFDPDFAMAHMRLGQYYAAVVGRNERALAELDRAYQLREGVTDREQRRIEAEYYDLQERYDEKSQSLQALVSLYPDDEKGHAELAAAYYDLGQLDKAIQEVRETLRLNPSSAPAYGALVLYLARESRTADAIEAAREAEQRDLGSPRMHWGLGLAYLGEGNAQAAREQFQRIGRATETDRDLQTLCLVIADLYEGKLGLAANQLATQIQAVPPLSTGLQLFRRYLLGRIHLMRRDSGGAAHQADLMLRTPGSNLQGGDFLHAGTLYARSGRLVKAHQVLRHLEERQRANLSSTHQDYVRNLEGEILLAEANPAQAETSFSMHTQSFMPVVAAIGLARAHQTQRRWEMAATEWEQVLAERGQILQNGFPPDLTIAHLELARAYRQTNHHDLAGKHYEEALRMLQHADEFNLLRDARREYYEVAPRARPRN